MPTAKVRVTKPKVGRLQIRISNEDEKLLNGFSKDGSVDKSQFVTLLIRKYGKALAQTLSREEAPQAN